MLVWIPTEIFQTTIFAQMSGPLVSQWLKYLLVNIRTECGEHRSNNWDKWSKKILLSCQLTNLHQNTRISLTDGKYFSDLFWEWIVFQWFNSWRDIFYSLRKGKSIKFSSEDTGKINLFSSENTAFSVTEWLIAKRESHSSIGVMNTKI